MRVRVHACVHACARVSRGVGRHRTQTLSCRTLYSLNDWKMGSHTGRGGGRRGLGAVELAPRPLRAASGVR